MSKTLIASGSSNPKLATEIADSLDIPLCALEIETFPNGELRIRILDDVKNKHLYIIQSTSYPAERHLFEMLFIADAAKRMGAKRITGIIPWFGYSAQDKVFRKGEPLSASIAVKLLESSDVDDFVILDIHSTAVLKYFKKPVVHLSAMSEFINYFRDELDNSWTTVSLDKGAQKRAFLFSQKLHIPLVQFDKTRDRKTGEVTFHSLDGNVEGKKVISFDDFVSTGGSRIRGCNFLKDHGAERYYDCVTHLIVPETTSKLKESQIDRVFISNSIYLKKKYYFDKLNIVSVAPVISAHIKQSVQL